MDPLTGGICQAIRNLYKVLDGMNISAEVVSLDDPKASFIGSDPFITYPLGPGKSSWQYSSKLLPWLVKNLNRFDTVVVHGIWLYHVYAAVKALEMLKSKNISFRGESGKIAKLFIMPHGMLDPYFQNASGRKLKALRNWMYWNLIESKNIKKVNGLLFTCEVELQLARQNFRPYKPKIEINVGYGIEEVPAFTSEMKTAFLEKCPELKEFAYFLFLSRIHPKKGVDMLINAYIEFFKVITIGKEKDNYPKLVIAGPAIESNYGKDLQQLILKCPEIQSSIFFPGMLTGNAKWGAIHGCEAFVLPSHQENFGIAVVEALACKKPVLISNQINIWKEIITNDGGIAKDDTLEGTIELLKSWTQLSGENKLTMAQNARSSFEKNFSIIPAAIRFFKAINNN